MERGFTNFPIERPEQSPIKTAMDMIREEFERVANNAEEFRAIKGTLIVNCQPNRALWKLGIAYDEKRSALHNLVFILEKLIAIADKAKRDNAALSPESRERHYPTDGNRP